MKKQPMPSSWMSRAWAAATVLAVMLAAGVLTTAHADTIFNDFGSNQTFDYSDGVNLAIFPKVGESFTPHANFTLTQIAMALNYSPASGAPDRVRVELTNDANGLPGSTVLESWTLTNMPAGTGAFAATTFDSTGGVDLQKGTRYWLVVAGGGPFGWNLTNVDSVGYLYHGFPTLEAISNNVAYSVQGALVTPEPATWILLGTGILGLGLAGVGLRRRGTSPDHAWHGISSGVA